MKKLLPLLLLFLLVTSLKANYFSAPTTEGVMLHYAVTSPTEPYTVMVMYCESNAVEVTIPSIIGYNEIDYIVTSIDNGAFSSSYSLTSITIPESVTSIGSHAFYNTPWYNNKPDGVVYIGKILYDYKGEMSPNTEIEVLEGTVSIGDNAFDEKIGLTSITIPGSVTSIGSYAFAYCSGLTTITIPESVTSISHNAFYNTPWYNNNQME